LRKTVEWDELSQGQLELIEQHIKDHEERAVVKHELSDFFWDDDYY
jgi:hypothetical protein